MVAGSNPSLRNPSTKKTFTKNPHLAWVWTIISNNAYQAGCWSKATSDIISNLGLSSCTAQFTCDLDSFSDPIAVAQASWSLEEFSNAYQQLLADFKNVDQGFCKTPQQAFLVRTLLIHQYRRILLKDPQLPSQILPTDWAGNQVRVRVAQIYKILSPVTDQYLNVLLNDRQGQPLMLAKEYGDRFAAS